MACQYHPTNIKDCRPMTGSINPDNTFTNQDIVDRLCANLREYCSSEVEVEHRNCCSIPDYERKVHAKMSQAIDFLAAHAARNC